MENIGIWKLIKAGFWLGIGFIIPSIIVYMLGTATVYSALPYFIKSNYGKTMAKANANDSVVTAAEKKVENYMSDYDKTEQVEILSYRDNSSDKRLLILGTLKNKGDAAVSSVHLEAELMDDQGMMVYECEEYIMNKIGPGNEENFQISCGCSQSPIPDYTTASVRITKAAAY